MTRVPARESLEQRVGHSFDDPGLLEAALVHRSYTSEHPSVADNERMEFLGDAVLQLAVTDYLYANHPGLDEGEMAKVRAACVNRATLADIARQLELGGHLRIGLGESQSGGQDKDSILADGLEAVLAAVYLDSGYPTARQVVLRLWKDLVDQKASAPGRRDYKTRLQEVLAAIGSQPRYEVVGAGPDHARSFEAVVIIDGVEQGRGSGRSKKEAQQEAARVALEQRSTVDG